MVAKGYCRDEYRDREPYPAQEPYAQHVPPVDARGQLTYPQSDGEPRHAEDTHGLAQQEPGGDAQGYTAGQGFGQGLRGKDYAGIGKREDGQYGEADPRVNELLETLHGSLGAAAEVLDPLHNGLSPLFVVVLHRQPEIVEQVFDDGGVVPPVEVRLGRHDRSQQDPRQRGMNSGLQEEQPHHDAHD